MAFSKLIVLVFLNCLFALPTIMAIPYPIIPCLADTASTISLISPITITPPAGVFIKPDTTVTVKFFVHKAMTIPDANIQVGTTLGAGTVLSSTAAPIYKPICSEGISDCQDIANFQITLKLSIPSDAIGSQVLGIKFKNTATGSVVGCAKVTFPVTTS